MEGTIASVAIDHQMAGIPIQVGRNTVKDVLLDGGLSVNTITEDLRKGLGLLSPKSAPYNLRMAVHTTTKQVGLVKAIKTMVFIGYHI